ncbi:hypothetical protein BGX26_001916 [Mortierella sp. AD094]|nr:hypothetical protein BGX26_001916 [Mortierella sp. AD094]
MSGLRTPFLNLQAPFMKTNKGSRDIRGADISQIKGHLQPIISLSGMEASQLDIAFDIRSTSKHLDTRELRPIHTGSQDLHLIRDEIASTPELEIQMNQGLIQRIVTDPSYRDRLESMGLTQYNAYDCILSLLFRPTLAMQGVINQYRAVFQTPGVTTIGIHFPAREPRHQQQELTLDDFEYSIPCAQDLSRAIKMRTKNTDERFLYVISADSESTRTRIQKEYGKNLDLIFPPSPRSGVNSQKLQGEPKQHLLDEEAAVLDSYLFSETDYQIITSFSSFGKLALFRRGASGRESAVLMPSKRQLEIYNSREGSRGTTREAIDQATMKTERGLRLPDCSRVEYAIAPWELIASFDSLG